MTRKTRYTGVHGIGFFVLSAFLLGCPMRIFAETSLVISIATGSDDLRGGNTAFISFVRTDGREVREQILSSGEGGGAISTRRVTFPETLNPSDLRSIRIRHDGNPRSGHPFDTYDNWNLSALRVQLVDATCRATWHVLYNSSRDPLFRAVRFTGALRQIELPIRTTIPSFWCTHGTAQRLEGDINGDGQVDAVCHDRISGKKWIALRDSADLVQTWVDDTNHWCSHAGAALFVGDVNGDRRADLICKDPARIWLDYSTGEGSYFRGAGPVVDTTWCTHAGDTFFVGDQNGDGRADLVCRSSDGFYSVDFADSSGLFSGTTDASGRAPDFVVTNIVRWGDGYRMSIRNNGAEGYAESFWCSASISPSVTYRGYVHINTGQTATFVISHMNESDVISCWAGGRGIDSAREIFVSNNKLTKCFR